MSVFTAVFEIPGSCTDSIEHLKRQALYRLADMIPPHVEITGEWVFTPRTHRGKRFWLVAEAPARGVPDVSAAVRLADFVRADMPDVAAWIDRSTGEVAA